MTALRLSEAIDQGSVNVACGRCRLCKERQTAVCLNVNPARAGGAYGYVDMGGWIGGQTTGVGPGSTVYVAGAGPVGLAAAASARPLGVAVVIVGDVNPVRLAHARSVGFETADLSTDLPLGEQIAQILRVPEVDSAIDAVGLEDRCHGHEGAQHEASATVLNSLMEVTRTAGKIGIPGLYVTDDPEAWTVPPRPVR